MLKPAHRRILASVFAADEGTIKDLIPGKTGGLCILAWGNPGVGKTLTAEVFAEIKERPLYALSVSEIGTSPQEIEHNLQRIFTRVERWNAVLLFDECDVFLSKRGDDIHQSAIVGMFLRLRSLLAEAKIPADAELLDRLSGLELDGRKIRNLVRAIQLNGAPALT